ncbi:uncharacterized protein LOC127247204 [Andrographis paniculata]|uniref:uncharacterized protein LOC127247204 n=1 Tax=Andrographis paniculata TaxID=175694 RepID=UPI0021E8F283|nr:uncharacterized protein LOC127247204 [Andrographis paniculata]
MSAKIPHHHYTTISSPAAGGCFCTFPYPGAGGSVNYALQAFASFNDDDDVNSPVSVTSFPEQLLVSECGGLQAVPQMSSEIEIGSCDYQPPPLAGDDCSRLVPNLWPPAKYPTPAAADQNWPKETAAAEVTKVGRYSVEERKDRILRYLKKRNQRNFNKTIKYACRKTLADKRVRIRGRFAKNVSEEEEDEEMQQMMVGTKHVAEAFHYHQQSSSFMTTYDDEDEWLQAAMDNLVQLPYL